MSDELNNQQDETSAGAGDGAGAGGADDVLEALAEADSSIIVAEGRKPLNKSTIVTFVILVMGAGGVWFMYQRTGPSKAVAASKETAAAKQTINNFLSGGDQNIKLMETMLRSTQKVVEQFLQYPSMTQIPLSDLKANPFRLKPDKPGAEQTANKEADEKKKREEERLAALKAVQELQLQSIMYGESRRACMINGAMYTEGQMINGFAVEKINQASVVVKSGPYRFDLRMQR